MYMPHILRKLKTKLTQLQKKKQVLKIRISSTRASTDPERHAAFFSVCTYLGRLSGYTATLESPTSVSHPSKQRFTNLETFRMISLACCKSPVWHEQTLAHISIGEVTQQSFLVQGA